MFTDSIVYFFDKILYFLKEMQAQQDAAIPQLNFNRDGLIEKSDPNYNQRAENTNNAKHAKPQDKSTSRSTFMKNVNKVKSKDSFDDPSSNPYVINLART